MNRFFPLVTDLADFHYFKMFIFPSADSVCTFLMTQCFVDLPDAPAKVPFAIFKPFKSGYPSYPCPQSYPQKQSHKELEVTTDFALEGHHHLGVFCCAFAHRAKKVEQWLWAPCILEGKTVFLSPKKHGWQQIAPFRRDASSTMVDVTLSSDFPRVYS